MAILRVALSALDRALAAIVAVMLVLFVLGSGSIQSLLSVGTHGRWLALYALWCVAVALAVLTRHRPERVPVYVILALALPTLGLASATWSVAPRLSAERSVSLGILVTAGVALAYAAGARPSLVRWLIGGLVAGGVACALAGFVLVLVDHGEAVQSASVDSAWRLRGIGQNPNTFSMLAAVVLPLAAWELLQRRSLPGRLAFGAASLLLLAAVVGSGSRGAFLGAFGGVLMMAILSTVGLRARATRAAGAIVVFIVALVAMQLPSPTAPVTAAPATTTTTSVTTTTTTTTTTTSTTPAPPPPRPPAATDFFPGRMTDEVGRPFSGSATRVRSLIGSSGRIDAWRGALHQAGERPALGHGFGTEALVFVDRFYWFDGGVPENSWVGLALQLGAAGVALLAAFWIAFAWFVWRSGVLRDAARSPAIALLPVAVVGLILTAGQSYIYSVGNVATCSVWLCTLMIAGVARVDT